MKLLVTAFFVLVLSQAACSERVSQDDAPAPSSPLNVFWRGIASHCGQAFDGRITANVPPQPADAFAGQRLVMHVRDCSDNEIRIPFHVGSDRSRTWILTRTGNALTLKHDHRHADGTPDAVTMYGGDTVDPGTAVRQEFPVDAVSVRLFEREGLTASMINVWAMEIVPGERFVYELARPGTDRLFRVSFDLSAPVEAPGGDDHE